MIEIGIAHLRFAWSMIAGRPFHLPSLERLVDAVIETRAEFGAVGADAAGMLGAPELEEAAVRDMQLRRLRTLARRAENETPYYQGRCGRLGLDPARLAWDDVPRIPITPKAALREQPGGFVRQGVQVAFLATTTGSTGRPITMAYSEPELRSVTLFSALSMAMSGSIGPEDVVQVSTGSSETLSSACFTRACERVGAAWYPAGVVEPAIGLDWLRETRSLPGKQPRTSVLSTYPSYLGELVTLGLAAGLGPADFGLRRVSAGGEVLSEGLKVRARRLFGEGLRFDEGYGMTETWPFGAQVCEARHLHFDRTQGLVEVLDPETWQPTAPGRIGTLVSTPFPPYRETTVVLRYDTQDLVRTPNAPLTCTLRHMPATSEILGKRRLSVQHADGWTTPRDVIEALEGIAALPLPARCGLWAEGDGVAVEVLAPGGGAELRRAIGDALESRGVPLRALHLAETRDGLTRPLPLRGDLREATFARCA